LNDSKNGQVECTLMPIILAKHMPYLLCSWLYEVRFVVGSILSK